MSKANLQPYKGTRDFYPEDYAVQKYIFDTWSTTLTSFGYQRYDASVIEPVSLYQMKGQSSQEIIDKEIYTFSDRGDRQVVLRPEMTPTVSRMIAARQQELVYPVRWYSIPNLWRYDRPQKGRLREHWQLNVDIFGDDSLHAEHELLLISTRIMSNFGASQGMYSIRINHRQLTDYIVTQYLGLDEDIALHVVRLVDKKAKLTLVEFEEQLQSVLPRSQVEKGIDRRLIDILDAKSLSELPAGLKKTAAYKDLEDLIELCAASKVNNVVYDPTIMRGFDYYTGIVFEIFDTSPNNARSLFGGGRYDGMVEALSGTHVPTVGFGMGDVGTRDFLAEHDLLPGLKPAIDAVMILLEDVYNGVQPTLAFMRKEGLNIYLDYTERKLAKRIANVDKLGVKYVIFVGPEELKSGLFTLKNLATSKEDSMTPERILTKLLAARDNV